MRNTLALFYMFGLFSNCLFRDSNPGLACREYEETVLTHLLTPAGPVPTAFDPQGVYPYASYSETSDRPVGKKYSFVSIENDHLRATICPDLGGKVTSIIHKPSGKEVLYAPDVIRPVRILPRFCFVAGGTHWHEGYWIPAGEPLDIYTLALPAVKLRPVGEIPLFGWAREEDVGVWSLLEKAYSHNRKLPAPPEIQLNRWPPSGMEHLSPAFEWAMERSDSPDAELWRYYYGTWLAAFGAYREYSDE